MKRKNRKMIKRINFNEEKDFLHRIGDTTDKIVLSIGNGNIEPFFHNAKISDICLSKMDKVRGNKIVIDAHNINFPNNSIDIIYGWQMVHHLDINRFMLELKRVLKPNGKAVFVDNAYSPVWRVIRKCFPKTKDEPEEDFKEEYLQDKASKYGFSFSSKRYNFFAYLFQKAFRHIGLQVSCNSLVKIDTFLSRYKWFRNNLRNMVWELTPKTKDKKIMEGE